MFIPVFFNFIIIVIIIIIIISVIITITIKFQKAITKINLDYVFLFYIIEWVFFIFSLRSFIEYQWVIFKSGFSQVSNSIKIKPSTYHTFVL